MSFFLLFIIVAVFGAFTAAAIFRRSAARRASGACEPKRGWGKWAAIFVAVAIAIAVASGLRFVGSARVEQIAAVVDEQPNAWVDSFNGETAAVREPHTSMKTLTKFLADRINSTQDQIGGAGNPTRLFSLDDSTNELVADLRRQVSLALVNSAKPSTRPDNETWVELHWDVISERTVEWWPSALHAGKVVAVVTGPKGSAKILARLDEKPWLETPPAAVGREDYEVVTSSSPAASKEQALDQVRRQTIANMTQRIFSRGSALAGTAPTLEDARVQAAAVFASPPYVDQAVVALNRPYGPVWFAANLYHVTADELDRYAATAQHVNNQHRRNLGETVLAVGGMLLVLLLVYAGLNALTRGYFRAHLRAAVVVAVAVAVTAVLLLMG